jgi:hypothetical protein
VNLSAGCCAATPGAVISTFGIDVFADRAADGVAAESSRRTRDTGLMILAMHLPANLLPRRSSGQ